MSTENNILIDSCKALSGETSWQTSQRLETVIKTITETNNTSCNAIEVLAYALMEAPADFDYGPTYNPPPFLLARIFLGKQNDEVRAFFERECKKHPRSNNSRIKHLLTKYR